jgi:predicted CoA-substrate-specific enzyme activase
MTLSGFDVGSRTAKCFNEETQESVIVDSHRWREILPKGEIVSTGYFRKNVPNTFNVTEITAAIYGTAHLLKKEVDVVLDIGGQDTKVIDTRTNEFRMNDRCSAGTGTFLEFMAGYFGIKLEEMEGRHFAAKRTADINSTCSVFAQSEAISRLVEGYSNEEVIRGIHLAFAKKMGQMVPDDAKTLAVVGGTAKNAGVVDALKEILKKRIFVPADPQIVNAVGAVQYYRQRIL